MPGTPVEKRITIIAFITAIGGLFIESAPATFMRTTTDYRILKLGLYELFKNVNLDFFRETMYMMRIGGGNSVGINVPSTLFYVLLLIGAILFSFKGFRQSRILEFCYAIIFFTCCTGILWTIYNTTKRLERINPTYMGWLIYGIFVLALWIWVSWFILTSIRSQRELKIQYYETGNVFTPTFEDADKFKRLYNMVIDRVLIILIFSPWAYSLASSIRLIEDEAGSRTTVYLLFIIGSFIYYPFFEGLFGATPGKFLTGTRVTDEAGNKPSFLSIMGRTLSRFVPFDALSFFGTVGWHDKWSDTYVLKEKTKDNLAVTDQLHK